MKPNERKWQIIKKGNGKFYPRVYSDHLAPHWPWSSGEFDTLEEAKTAITNIKKEFERIEKENEETLVWEE